MKHRKKKGSATAKAIANQLLDDDPAITSAYFTYMTFATSASICGGVYDAKVKRDYKKSQKEAKNK